MMTCDRGILAKVTHAQAIVSLSEITISFAQNGIELESTAPAMYCAIHHNTITCNRYEVDGLRHRDASTGIEIRNTSIGASMLVDNNTVQMNIVQAFSSLDFLASINPTAIIVVDVIEQSAQSCSISSNDITIVAGVEGIRVENVQNTQIVDNNPISLSTYNSIISDLIIGIVAVNCLDATISCNVIGGSSIKELGINTQRCPNLSINDNILDALNGVTMTGAHSTSCSIGGNDFRATPSDPAVPDGRGWGLLYNNALTGPQYKTGNTWEGDYLWGAFYNRHEFSPCLSQHTVTPPSNVGDYGPLNPVFIFMPDTCTSWFLYDTGTEGSAGCGGGTTVGRSAAGGNEADALLTSGGFAQLGAGWRWATEAAVYQKFAEHPEWAANMPSVQQFMQAQSETATGKMYGVRQVLAGLRGEDASLNSSERLNMIQSATNLDAETIQNILPEPLSVEQKQESEMAIAAVKSANTAVSCTNQPCLNEQWLYNLYATVALEKSRDMTLSEAAQLRHLALTCASAGGTAVYMARSWHYIRTGERINDSCTSTKPSNGIEERSTQRSEPTESLYLSPNPAGTQVMVSIPLTSKAVQLQMVDLYGRIAHQMPVALEESSVTMPVAHLSSGLYQVRLLDGSGKITAFSRVVIAH